MSTPHLSKRSNDCTSRVLIGNSALVDCGSVFAAALSSGERGTWVAPCVLYFFGRARLSLGALRVLGVPPTERRRFVRAVIPLRSLPPVLSPRWLPHKSFSASAAMRGIVKNAAEERQKKAHCRGWGLNPRPQQLTLNTLPATLGESLQLTGQVRLAT